MRWLKRIIAGVAVAAVVFAFCGVRPFAWAAKVQIGSFAHRGVLGFALMFAVGLLTGRLFCEILCPLGILQSVVNRLFHRNRPIRRVCTQLPTTKVQFVVRVAVLAVVLAVPFLGFVTVGTWTGLLDPYAIFGRALSLRVPLIRENPLLVAWGSLGILIVVLAAFGKGRIWCNWVCPYGTILAFCGRFSLLRNKMRGLECGNCRACSVWLKERRVLGDDDEGDRADQPEEQGTVSGGGVTRRETLKGVAVLAAAEKLTDGGYAPVSLPGTPVREKAVLPPGAGDAADFARRCVSCQLCVVNCPEACLRPSTDLRDFGQPKLDFRHGHCLVSCTRCGEVCPAGAIRKIPKAERLTVHMGQAVWKADLCLRVTKGEECSACSRKCPVEAIHLIPGKAKGRKGRPPALPMVDANACIGCGACEHVCPVRPEPAIRVEGYERQKIVRRIGPSDVVAEMMRLVENRRNDVSVAVAKDGVIVARETGRGVSPLLKLLDAGALRDAVVVDRVIGRAAAAICIVGGAKAVHASVMCTDAEHMLRERKITAGSKNPVAVIRNSTGTGVCPLEEAVRTLNDPNRMVKVLRRKLAELKDKAAKAAKP